MQNIIKIIIVIISFYIASCSRARLTPKDDAYLCLAFEKDSKEMLGKYFEQWSNDIQPISIYEKSTLNDTIKIIYKIFEDYIDYYIDSNSLQSLIKPYTMIQNEISFSISNLETLTYEPYFEIELLSLQPSIYNSLVELPTLVKNKETLISLIKYPEIAVRAGIKGYVALEFLVDTLGAPQNIQILRGIGGGCDEAVIKALKSSKFIPARMNGRKVEQTMRVLFRFVPRNKGLAGFNLKLNKSIVKNGVVHNFRPMPKKLPNTPVYVTEAKKSSLDSFIHSDCGDDLEEKYNNKFWKGWPRANFIERMTHLNASMMSFHYYSIPYVKIIINNSFNQIIVLASKGPMFIRELFKLEDNKWVYIKSISFGIE